MSDYRLSVKRSTARGPDRNNYVTQLALRIGFRAIRNSRELRMTTAHLPSQIVPLLLVTGTPTALPYSVQEPS